MKYVYVYQRHSCQMFGITFKMACFFQVKKYRIFVICIQTCDLEIKATSSFVLQEIEFS